jgi:hypothetical protein
MNGYRIYFVDVGRTIRAARWFEAEDDASALWVAERLADACSDVWHGFELWHRARRIHGGNGSTGPTESIACVNTRLREEVFVSVAESLLDSVHPIASSRRLTESINRAKHRSAHASEAAPPERD